MFWPTSCPSSWIFWPFSPLVRFFWPYLWLAEYIMLSNFNVIRVFHGPDMNFSYFSIRSKHKIFWLSRYWNRIGMDYCYHSLDHKLYRMGAVLKVFSKFVFMIITLSNSCQSIIRNYEFRIIVIRPNRTHRNYFTNNNL